MESNDKKGVIIAMIVGIAGLFMTITFVGQGNIRHVDIFLAETVKQTIVFEEINGETQVRGIKGIGSGVVNPTLLSHTSFAYVLTVINNGTTLHRLYIDGFNVQTELPEPGQQESIAMHPNKEGEFTYYDKKQHLTPLGKIKIVSVVPSDDFQGIWEDLI